ncbi:MAG: hypothetical protein ABIN97_04155 [Ginsengibacter sp.]
MALNEIEYKAAAAEASKLTAMLRGLVMNSVAHLEIVIDTFLAHHFCKTNRDFKDFMTFILPSNIIIFENKRNIFKKVVEAYYPNLKKEVPNFHALLGKIRDRRNEFAHYPLDITPEGVQLFLETKNIILLDSTKTQVRYTSTQITELGNTIQELSNKITKYLPI